MFAVFNGSRPFVFHRVIPYRGIPAHRVTSSDMKMILLFIGLIALLSTSGCIVADDGRDRHARYEHHDDVIVGPPVVVVRPPEVIVR
jgi:hypothetical protein